MARRGKTGAAPRLKKTGKEVRNAKYRPQDPERLKHLTTTKATHNATPTFDADAMDVPAMPTAAFMPVDDVPAAWAVPAARPGKAGGGKGGGKNGDKAQREAGVSARQAKIAASKQKRKAAESRPGGGGAKAKRKKGGESKADGNSDEDGSADAEADDGDDAPKAEATSKATRSVLSVSDRRPGESAHEYRRRVDAAAQQALRDARKKASTDRNRERNQKNRSAKKKKRAEELKKKASKAKKKNQVERPDFREVVIRPPILSASAQKSRSKAKEHAAKTGAVGAPSRAVGKPATAEGKSSEISDYAAKIREAYALMKKKRHGDSAI